MKCALVVLYSIQCLYHNDAVASDDHHADVVPGTVLAFLDGLIDDHVHERIKAPQNSGNNASSIQF